MSVPVETLDPVDYAVISQSLIAAAREMGAKLIRSAYSTVLREARDGSGVYVLTIAPFTLIKIEAAKLK